MQKPTNHTPERRSDLVTGVTSCDSPKAQPHSEFWFSAV